MSYAVIENGVVVNIIRLNDRIAHNFPNAVKFVNMPVGIGDTYADGVFYRDGEEILPYEVLAAESSVSIEEMDEAYREGVNSV